MKTKLIVALFSAALLSAGPVNSAVGHFSYPDALKGDLNYPITLYWNEVSDDGLMASGDMQAEGAWDWAKKVFPWVSGVYKFVDILNEYGIPAFHAVSEYFEEKEITDNCNFFYEYEDYLDGIHDDPEWYEGSVDYEALTDDEYYALKDLCHAKRPRT